MALCAEAQGTALDRESSNTLGISPFPPVVNPVRPPGIPQQCEQKCLICLNLFLLKIAMF